MLHLELNEARSTEENMVRGRGQLLVNSGHAPSMSSVNRHPNHDSAGWRGRDRHTNDDWGAREVGGRTNQL